MYVMRAGMEEARILYRRQPIDEVIAQPDVDAETKRKLQLTLEARAFTETLGLVPKGSFTKYAKIDRDVLLWVLSGSSKIALAPATWWFPIVGSIPYKGFFDKAEADAEAKKLADKDLDVYLRPSAAFSTLGWFDDPLLSTTLRFDEVSLVNTVIHEILHNTIWIKDHVPFNETLANFVGAIGVIEFYTKKEGEAGEHVVQARARWKEELEFARFLERTVADLEPVYHEAADSMKAADEDGKKELYAKYVGRRDEVLKTAVNKWTADHPTPEAGKKSRAMLNNAVIIAHQIYLTKPWIFEELLDKSDFKLSSFIERMKFIQKQLSAKKTDPYQAVLAYLADLKSEKALPTAGKDDKP